MAEIEVGSPSGPVVALVDEEDRKAALVYAWHMAGGKGGRGKYAAASVRRDGRQTTIYLHRLVAYRMGLLPSLGVQQGAQGRWSQSIDHRNGNKLDNRRENLRLRTRSQQMRNPSDKPRSTNKSGMTGVSYVKSRERYGKPWTAEVMVNYKTKRFGWYATVEEAKAARRAWDEGAAARE